MSAAPAQNSTFVNVASAVGSTLLGVDAILLPAPLSNIARQQAIQNWPAERRYFRQLVGMADTLKAQLDQFPPAPAGDFRLVDLRGQLGQLYATLTTMAAAKQTFENEIRTAVTRLQEQGKVEANETYEIDLIDRPGVAGLGAVLGIVAIAAAIVAAGIVSVLAWKAWLDYRKQKPIAEQQAQALAVATDAYKKQLDAALANNPGAALPPPPFDTGTANQQTAADKLAGAAGGIGIAAVAMVGLYLLTRGGGR